MGKSLVFALGILFFPGLLSATCSFDGNYSPDDDEFGVPHQHTAKVLRNVDCVHGWCSNESLCVCDPCWTGPQCEYYVDRFAPRFLADEPFFILEEEDGILRSRFPPFHPERLSQSSLPLFRIESSDDDLGLTCQLGQPGPAATCPCATPRFRISDEEETRFRVDSETGDVFIKDETFTLQPTHHYAINLVVSALEVNETGYVPYKEEIQAIVWVRPKQQLEEDEMTNHRGETRKRSSRKWTRILFPRTA